jgi:DNA polymerase-3 subunit epsilon
MRELFFDLETTGLPERRYSSYSSYFPPNEFFHYNCCRVVSIAWIIYENGVKAKEAYYVIFPDGFISSPKSLEIHKITDEYAKEHGTPISLVFAEFYEDLSECQRILSYNLDFDYNVFMAECWRYKRREIIKTMTEIIPLCIMKKSKEILGTIEGVDKKYFKLEEVYRFLFKDKSFQTAHNALDDTQRCADVFYKLMII